MSSKGVFLGSQWLLRIGKRHLQPRSCTYSNKHAFRRGSRQLEYKTHRRHSMRKSSFSRPYWRRRGKREERNNTKLAFLVTDIFRIRPFQVYAWGQNNCGQVGNSISTNQGVPRQVNSSLLGKKIVHIACGQTSSMALTENGEVYGWGYNGVGQLGIGNYVNQPNPCRVGSLIGVVIGNQACLWCLRRCESNRSRMQIRCASMWTFSVKVVCGYAHTLALTDEGKLYVWGGNSYGQLGIGNKTNACNPVTVNLPLRYRRRGERKRKMTFCDWQLDHAFVQKMGRVSDIAALHYNHISIAVGEGGCIYMWGHCRGQSITTPTSTPFSSIHDALACYASPSVMHEPLVLHTDEESSILESLSAAFDDSVCFTLFLVLI